MYFRYENVYQRGIKGESAVYGRFTNRKDAIQAAREVLKNDPLGKGWDYVKIFDRKAGVVCDDYFDWQV